MRRKKALTLIEIMIVIFLITLITGAIGYNMKGSLNKGRELRTIQAKEQLQDLLLICLEESKDKKVDNIIKNPVKYLRDSGLAKNPEKLIVDGWGEKFDIKFDSQANEFKVSSSHVSP